MRYALQNYSRANISLVKGKRGWRVAGASSLSSINPRGNTSRISAFARISELVVRLVQGEDPNEYLFEALSQAHDALCNGAETATVEIVCAARVLYALGYISAEALDTALFSHTAYGIEHLKEADALKDKLLSCINRAISETHL